MGSSHKSYAIAMDEPPYWNHFDVPSPTIARLLPGLSVMVVRPVDAVAELMIAIVPPGVAVAIVPAGVTSEMLPVGVIAAMVPAGVIAAMVPAGAVCVPVNVGCETEPAGV